MSMSILVATMMGMAMLAESALAQSQTPRTNRVLTQDEQNALTPDSVLETLRSGNQRFSSGTITSRDHSALVRDAASGQFPKAIVLSCVDSRIPVEDVFDRGIGDIFVARVAGNFSNTDILGSMEFATRVSGAKLVLVMGHEDCGAIKSAIDHVELGNITEMLSNIEPAVDALADYDGDRTSANPDFVSRVARKNVELTMDDIRRHSPILKQMEEQGQIKIVGAMYDMESGRIDFLDGIETARSDAARGGN
jgi:carbonic anhydrase